MTVDFQTHWWPRPLFDPIVGRERYPRATPKDGGYRVEFGPGLAFSPPSEVLDLERQLAGAADAGVDVMVGSPMQLGEVWDYDESEAAEHFLALNEEFASAQRRHAGRYVGLAMLPMQHFELSLEVLDNAIDLGLRGVCILATTNGRQIANETTLPLYQRMEEAGMTIFLHPMFNSFTVQPDISFFVEGGAGWMHQTTIAALTLVATGTLDSCPGLRVVHPHLGGTLPFVLGRVDRFPLGEAEHRVAHYLEHNFYTDTASFTPGALRLAIDTYGIDRVLLGSDYPLWPLTRNLEFLAANCTPEEKATILSNSPDSALLQGPVET